jgi:hypothetical protein
MTPSSCQRSAQVTGFREVPTAGLQRHGVLPTMAMAVVALMSIATSTSQAQDPSDSNPGRFSGNFYSASWDVRQWAPADPHPMHDFRLANKATPSIFVSAATWPALAPGDVNTPAVREYYVASIASFGGAEILYSDSVTVGQYPAFRVGFKVANVDPGSEEVRLFISVLIVNGPRWHVFQCSAPLTQHIQGTADLWEATAPILKSIRFAGD